MSESVQNQALKLHLKDKFRQRYLSFKETLINLTMEEEMEMASFRARKLLERQKNGEVLGEETIFRYSEGGEMGLQQVADWKVDFGDSAQVTYLQNFVPALTRTLETARKLPEDEKRATINRLSVQIMGDSK